jgi:hypothetical protein
MSFTSDWPIDLCMRVTNWPTIFMNQCQFSDPDFISGTLQRKNVQFADIKCLRSKFLFAFWSLKPVLFLSCSSVLVIQSSQRHSVINHCDRHFYSSWWDGYIFGLFNISSKLLLHLECYLIKHKRHIKISK